MCSRVAIVSACLTAAGLLCPTDVEAQEAARPAPTVAIVHEVKGTVTVKHPNSSTTTATAGNPLRVDDSVICDGSASITVVDSEGKVRTLTGPDCARTRFAYAAGRFASALDRYGKLGGRPRASIPGLLIWPVTGVRALPQSAALVEWRPQTRGNGTIAVRANSGEVLWTQVVDGSRGSLQDSALVERLERYADSATREVTIELRFSATQSEEASLTLVGGEERRRLDQQLMSFEGLPDKARLLFRADAFLQEGLQREALDAYVDALARVSEASYLVQKAANLAIELGDRRAGDLARRAASASGP